MAQVSVATANGNYPADGVTLFASRKAVAVYGNYAGASVALQLSLDDGATYQTVHTFTSASPEPKGLDYTGGKLRFAVSDATAATSVQFYIT